MRSFPCGEICGGGRGRQTRPRSRQRSRRSIHLRGARIHEWMTGATAWRLGVRRCGGCCLGKLLKGRNAGVGK